MKPFLKWAGNKFRIVERIKAVLPEGSRLIEPFAGSGALFLNTDYESYLLADGNADLINLYLTIQAEKHSFIEYAESLFVRHNNDADAYYAFRDEFNNSRDSRRKAALFIYLNRHCFNGLCRYNSSGGFNVPFGRYSEPAFPRAELEYFAEKSQRCEFRVADFRETLRAARSGDVVYCDPPYVPLSPTASFTDYTAEGFGEKAQLDLASLAIELKQRGVPVVISNHDTPFTRKAYEMAEIRAFDVQRFISSKADSRGKAAEILAIFY